MHLSPAPTVDNQSVINLTFGVDGIRAGRLITYVSTALRIPGAGLVIDLVVFAMGLGSPPPQRLIIDREACAGGELPWFHIQAGQDPRPPDPGRR